MTWKSPPAFSLTTEAERMSLASTLLPIVDRLEVKKRVLLAAAWTRTDERRLFEMYPEVLMFDVTFQMNSNEGRPLGVTCSPDGNMNIFTPFRAFLPEKSKATSVSSGSQLGIVVMGYG